MQLTEIHPEIDALQKLHGSLKLAPIYGAGCIKNPKAMLLFMNPTGKNISSNPAWNGLRAPWLGTKNVWKILHHLRWISLATFQATQELKPTDWKDPFCRHVYSEVSKNKVFITNLAKCTQDDARPLSNTIFREYLPYVRKEILLVNPKKIILFGNQVSSVLLGKPISVGDYRNAEFEDLQLGRKKFKTYPTFYPLGQGQRNKAAVLQRLEAILKT